MSHKLLIIMYPLIHIYIDIWLHTLQNEDYRLRYAASEWSKIEYELTRERGLWGPEIPAQLDKWMLDTVEGSMHASSYLSL